MTLRSSASNNAKICFFVSAIKAACASSTLAVKDCARRARFSAGRSHRALPAALPLVLLMAQAKRAGVG